MGGGHLLRAENVCRLFRRPTERSVYRVVYRICRVRWWVFLFYLGGLSTDGPVPVVEGVHSPSLESKKREVGGAGFVYLSNRIHNHRLVLHSLKRSKVLSHRTTLMYAQGLLPWSLDTGATRHCSC
ncbi:hypothetical protein CEXT_94651 [Caerostris extrusa]|uniref:Uncharacterized protein n=1 Tax=Caerostris extrusa TaxID=172846 RepID=A0AAV4NSG4_CAEEX|nr:hypothetical protein CEXT_94651 [Caerostris extrusa]